MADYDGHSYLDDDDGHCLFCSRPKSAHSSASGLPASSIQPTMFDVFGEGERKPGSGESGGAMLSRAAALANQKDKPSSRQGTVTRSVRNVIYSFGDSAFGRLGVGSEEQVKVPKQIGVLHDKDVIQLCVGKRHAIAVTNEGEVYTWGHGGSGQLGHGGTAYATVPLLLTSLTQRVAMVAAGQIFSMALTFEGSVFTWGDNSAGQLGLGDKMMRTTPTQILHGIVDRKVIHISAGYTHAACVTDNHEVFTWGDGKRGKLGHGSFDDCLLPKRVESLDDGNIRQVRCLETMTVMTTVPFITVNTDIETGVLGAAQEKQDDAFIKSKLRSMSDSLAQSRKQKELAEKEIEEMQASKKSGENLIKEREVEQMKITKENIVLFRETYDLKRGIDANDKQFRLLQKDLDDLIATPQTLASLSARGVKQIAFGKKHVLVLLDSRDVFAFGDNRRGQLGFGTKEPKFSMPERNRSLSSKEVKQLACGEYHSVAVTVKGDVWTWGEGSKGQLGLGIKEKRLVPMKVKGLLEHERVELVGCGTTFTVALTGKGEMFMWGKGDFAALIRAIDHSVPVPVTTFKRVTEAQAESAKTAAGTMVKVTQKMGNRKFTLSRADIKALIDMGMDVEDVEKMFPEVQADDEAALFLSQEINKALLAQKRHLQLEIKRVRKHAEEQQQRYVLDQEKALIAADQQLGEKLRESKGKLEKKVHDRESMKIQLEQDKSQLESEIRQLHQKISTNLQDMDIARTQSKEEERAALIVARKDIHTQLRLALQDRVDKLNSTKRALESVTNDLNLCLAELKQLRVDLHKYESSNPSDQQPPRNTKSNSVVNPAESGIGTRTKSNSVVNFADTPMAPPPSRLSKSTSVVGELKQNVPEPVQEVTKLSSSKFSRYDGMKIVVSEAHQILEEIKRTSLKEINKQIQSVDADLAAVLRLSDDKLNELEKRIEALDAQEVCEVDTRGKLQKFLLKNIQMRKQQNYYTMALLQPLEDRRKKDEAQRKQKFTLTASHLTFGLLGKFTSAMSSSSSATTSSSDASAGSSEK